MTSFLAPDGVPVGNREVSKEEVDSYVANDLSQEEIATLTEEHKNAPHLRILQRKLAEEITTMVHSKADLDNAIKASNILFGNSVSEELKSLNEELFLEIFEGVPQKELTKSDILGINIVDLLSEKSGFLKSKGEARRELSGNAISVNKEKVGEDFTASEEHLIAGKFLLLQKGKKNYFIVKVD